MGKTKASEQPARKCDLCGFTNKNAYIFKRHRLRCRRDKKKIKGGGTKIIIKPSVFGSVSNNLSSPIKVVKEKGTRKKTSPSMSPCKRGRNYSCENCSFTTTKSKAFLYHEIQVHRKAYSIFTCTECEYSSKHKQKVQRHLKLIHKKEVAFSDVKVAYNEEMSRVEERIETEEEQNDPRFKYNIDINNSIDLNDMVGMRSTIEEEIPDDVVVVLPEAPENPNENKEHITEEPGIEGKVYKCEYCIFNSNDKSKVAKHVVTNHLNAKLFQCTMCSFTTGRKIEFVAHKAKHRKLPAPQCGDSTDNKQDFDRHRENHNADNMFHENTVDNFQMSSRGSFSNDSAYIEEPQNDDMMTEGPSAGRNFVMGVQNTGTEQYYAHANTYNADTSLDYYGDNDNSLMSNYNNSSLNWSTDNDSFNYPSTSKQAAKRGEKLASKQAAILQGADGSFVCPLCGLKYKRSSDLNRHMKQKHNIRMKDYLDQQPTMVQSQALDLPPAPTDSLPPPPPLIPAPNQQDNSLTNIVQNQVVDDDGNIVDNQLPEVDGSFPDTGLKCPYCPYEAKWQDEFRKHLAIHQIERRYRCPHCDKQYKYVGDLNVHIRRDHKKEPEAGDLIRVPTIPNKKSSPSLFKCPACPFTSQWKTEVDRHSKYHIDDKPYRCNYCDYQTHWKGDIRRHMYKHHPEIMGDDTILDNVITIDYEKLTASKDLPFEMESQMNESYENNYSMDMMNDTPENSMDQSYEPMAHSYEHTDMSYYDSEPSSHEPSPVKELSPENDSINGNTGEVTTFKCEYCTFVTNAPSKLKAHVSTHMNLKQYMCPICGRRANWKWDIRKHIKKAHPETALDVVKLSRQEAEATIEKYLNSNPVVRREHHLNVALSQPQTVLDETSEIKNGKCFKCSACGYESNQRWIVSKHIRTVHPNIEVSIIYKGNNINRNMMTLMPSNESQMEPFVMSNERMDHNSSPIPTTILNVPNVNNEARVTPPKKESMSDKPFICMDCGKQCASKADIARHYYYMHRNMPVKVGYITDNGIVPIEKDDQGPKSNMQMKQQKGNETSPEKFLPLDIKPFMCAECGKRAALKGDVKKHYNYMHPGSEVRIIYVGDGMLDSGMVENPYIIGPPSEKMDMEKMDNMATVSPKTANKKAGLISANPKTFGYIKPFMCSECGRRSNWKWDLSKHMRIRHPTTPSHIITLSEAEARATYESYMQEFSQSVHTSPVKKHPSTKVNEKEYGLINFNRSAYRQFKCSACPYRSNWRSDLLRHIKRKHGVTKGHLIIMTIDAAKESLTTYDYNPRKRRRSGVREGETGEEKSEIREPRPKGPKHSEADKMGKIWKCARCSFVNKDKMVVARHLYSRHRVRAFTCMKCLYATNHRSSAYRHIKQRHETENISICKIGIKYIRFDPSRHTYVKSAIEKAKAQGINLDTGSAAAVGENGQLFPGFENAEDITEDENLNLKMEEDVEDDFETTLDETDKEEDKDEIKDTYTFKETFKCKLCTFQSTWRSCVCRHIRQKHKSTNYQRHIKCIKKIVKNNGLEDEEKDLKQYMCTVCPYRTAKNNLLTLHMNCHKPQIGVHQEKCRYCPYYVRAPRLIQQHEKLHLEEQRKTESVEQTSEEPLPSTSTKEDSVFIQPQTPTPTKRHQCQKCPYRTNSKNDFYYHKQFHRPKPTSEFKCDECDYWVGLRRLLKQHKKVHEADYKDRRSSTSSIQSSPCKSDFSESSHVFDSVQLAMYKQKIISSKIQPSISHSPVMSPMKIACTVGNRPGYIMKNGGYRKIHKCSKCPYQNVRLRNLRLHELMHGFRKSKNQLMKCPDCDYYVGSKGLLSHHMKVHLPSYMADNPDKSSTETEIDDYTGDEKDSDISDIQFETKVDTLYEIARFKKYSCEKCPYASAKRSHYERHVEIHGSKQRHMCKYCDYSVPSRNLLVQHERLHCTPNQNLLAIQSLSNLMQLPEVPADVALASALPPIDTKESFKVSVTHDHIELYENSNQFDIEPKKLYRCDRCPYANVRRDHLLTHLKFHMLKSTLACPYCDYSVSKTHHLSQHIRVHFCPLPELSNWLAENGQLDRVKQNKDPDISEALYVAQLYKRDGQKQSEENEEEQCNGEKEEEKGEVKMEEESCDSPAQKEMNGVENGDEDMTPVKENKQINEASKSSESDTDNEISFKDSSIIISPSIAKDNSEEPASEKDVKMEEEKTDSENGEKSDVYICQYCDRELDQSDLLVQHEMQHLIGNNYEVYLNQFITSEKEEDIEKPPVLVENGDEDVENPKEQIENITENMEVEPAKEENTSIVNS
ncbi:Hypothetical predicted protein [Mytilus galloprovincialis]|uniref:C2H2-type domain-containing protein n=1 Tax=Mytilus galloprovincialis TaxID=29158 RepID=A0A8B6CJC6_MYTGA|nr:Hypothetical predicted protein [Mytilus galloprovincialis]